MIHTHDWAYDIVRAAVADGHRTFRTHWQSGGNVRADRTREWIDGHRDAMMAALHDGC